MHSDHVKRSNKMSQSRNYDEKQQQNTHTHAIASKQAHTYARIHVYILESRGA